MTPRDRPCLDARDWAGLLIAAGASAFVYYPLLENNFVSDDFLNLYRIINCGFFEYVLTPHGGHTLVARNLVFYLCARVFGTHPAGYFWVVLISHLINVVLLYAVVRRSTASSYLACFGATLWGTSPVHDGALGWYAVYGHVMATTVLLLILRWALDIDGQSPERRRRTLRSCYIAALIGTISFGVGIGIAMVLPFVFALLAPSLRCPSRWRIPLLSLLVVVPAVYVGLFALNGFFFVGEGLETPGVVVKYIFALWSTIVPNTLHLLSYGVMRLLTTFRFDPAWITPATSYTVAGVFSAVPLAAAYAAGSNIRRQMLACVLLALACYGFIAMGRVALFQAFSSSMMAIQPRYHYTALVPVTWLMCLVLASVAGVRIVPTLLKTVVLVGVLAAIGFAYAKSEFQVDHHPESRTQVDEVMTTVMSSVEAAKIGDDVYIPNRSFSGFFVLPPTVFPGWAAIFAIYEPRNSIEGRHVYFVDKRLGVLIASAKGKRSSLLIVPPPTKEN